MSLAVTLMIEGQEDLTWERWQRLAEAAESGGFAGLFRSDHLTGLFGDPTRGTLPLIIGGRGERRTLRIVAEHADEWNTTRVTFGEYQQKTRVLEAHCRAIGRESTEIRRSLMIPIVIGRSSDEVRRRLDRVRAVFPRVPGDEAGWREAGFLYGSPDEIRRDLERWRELGITRVMLQRLDLTDLAALGLIASEIVLVMR